MRALLLNIALLAVPAFAQSTGDLASVSGSTLDAKGQPLKKCAVVLQPMPERGQNGSLPRPYGTMSDAQGHYSFDGVDPGRYTLRAEHPGYLTAMYRSAPAAPNTIATPGPQSIITLAPRQVINGANIQLGFEAVLSGKVLDEDGEPVPRISVRALRRTHLAGGEVRYIPASFANADDNGDYKLTGLTPGKFIVSAMLQPFVQSVRAVPGRAAEGLMTTYYPATTDIDAAEMVEVSAAANSTGKNIRLRKGPMFHIRGKVPAEGEQESIMVSLTPHGLSAAGMVTNNRMMQQKDGSFEFAGLAPGTYTVSMMKRPDGSPGQTQPVAARQVEITSHDMDGVTLEPVVLAELNGHIKSEAPVAELRVNLTPFDGNPAARSASVAPKADGAFTIPQVAPSHYRVGVGGLPAKAYVKSLKMAGQERLGIGIDLSKGVAGALEITIGSDGSEIAGAVKNKEGAAASACLVTLTPDVIARTDHYRQTVCDAAGHFSLRAVPPGNYRVHAWSGLEAGEQFDPEFIKLHQKDGQALQVASGVSQDLSLVQQ